LGIKKGIFGEPLPAASLSAILPRESLNPLFYSQGLLISFCKSCPLKEESLQNHRKHQKHPALYLSEFRD
jgi:hypothetical protein